MYGLYVNPLSNMVCRLLLNVCVVASYSTIYKNRAGAFTPTRLEIIILPLHNNTIEIELSIIGHPKQFSILDAFCTRQPIPMCYVPYMVQTYAVPSRAKSDATSSL